MLFQVLMSKFVKFIMSILNCQVNLFSNSASFFIVITHNSPVNFKLIYFLLWIKVPHKSPNFETFKCSGENLLNSSCYLPNHISVFLQILHHSLVSWNKLLCIILVQTLYTLLKSSPLKCKDFKLSSAWVKIRQILYVSFETASQSLFRFFIILQCYNT